MGPVVIQHGLPVWYCDVIQYLISVLWSINALIKHVYGYLSCFQVKENENHHEKSDGLLN